MDDFRQHRQSVGAENPPHYKFDGLNGLEIIDVARVIIEENHMDGWEAVCFFNNIRYNARYKRKNGFDDVKKAEWWAHELRQYEEQQKVGTEDATVVEWNDGSARTLRELREKSDKQALRYVINTLAERIHANAVGKGFWGQLGDDACVPEKLALIHSEVSEVLEELRAGHGMQDTYYEEDGKPCGVPSELADIIIRTLDLAEAFDVDLGSMIVEKVQFNSSRPKKHGKRF